MTAARGVVGWGDRRTRVGPFFQPSDPSARLQSVEARGVRITTMHPTCPDCDAPGVQSDEATFNVVYVCPSCERQLACQYARE